MEEYKIEEEVGRIDSYLASKLGCSRSKVAKMLKTGKIKVNGKVIKASYIPEIEDVITVEPFVEETMSAEAEEMDLDIVYEDDDVIVVNKANGVVVHPAIGNNHGTLVNGLINYSDSLSDVNGEFRPGIVHRIDADTTGLLMVAKNNEAHAKLAEELSRKETTRKYWALVWGVIKHDTGTIDAPIGRDNVDRKKMAVVATGKPAVTHFRVLERYKHATLIELQLETGRTHQIRVHMNYINFPVVNDPVYGKRKIIDDTGQCLHAKTLGFIHPRTGEYMEFDSELPECFVHIMNILKEE